METVKINADKLANTPNTPSTGLQNREKLIPRHLWSFPELPDSFMEYKGKYNNIAPDELFDAKQIYEDLKFTPYGKIKKPLVLATVALYIAQRKNVKPYTRIEIIQYMGFSGGDVDNVKRTIPNGLKVYKRINKTFLPVVTHDMYIDRFCKKLGIKIDNLIIINQISNTLDNTNNTNPACLAGAIIYYVMYNQKDIRTQEEIAQCIGITPLSIRSALKKNKATIKRLYIGFR